MRRAPRFFLAQIPQISDRRRQNRALMNRALCIQFCRNIRAADQMHALAGIDQRLI